MAIPNEQEFLEAMEALAEPLPESLIRRLSSALMLADDQAPAMALIRDIERWESEQLDKALNTTAAKWLSTDPMIIRAYQAARKRVAGIGPDEIVEMFYKRIRTCVPVPDSHLLWVDLQSVRDTFYKYTRVWMLALLRAFHEYHFKPDIIKQSVLTEKQLIVLKQAAADGAEALRQLELYALPMRPNLYSLHGSSREKINDRIDADLRRINRIYDDAKQLMPPIKRNDLTAKERLLVYRLWEAHTAIFRHHKPRAIQIILLTEGVENQIDERTVEKMCAGFKVSRKTSKTPYIRRLFAEIRGEKYRGVIRAHYEKAAREEWEAEKAAQGPLATTP